MKNKRFCAGLLAILLLFSLSAPLARADEDGSTLHIASMQDWKEFTRLARLDSWSDGLTVLLDTDLDLTYCDSVPTFGGTFDGNGHQVHLAIDREGDDQGLFRYLREGGVIQNLTVVGTVAPTGHARNIGGIVGNNAGIVRNCRSQAVVSGSDFVGGIVGVNQVTGRIEGCSTQGGVISGEHSTGGIVGSNLGAVVNCVNRAMVNPHEVSPTTDLENFDWQQINSAENFPAGTDTGGIAGYSGGLVQDCVNEGLIGYPHVGYNVGGVAGRQSGQLVNCTNRGTVRGRKDVGGVVGQGEPFTELKYQEDTLKKLAKELDRLSALMNQSLDSVDGTRHALSDHMTTVTTHTGNAKNHVSDLLDELEDVGDQTVDVANDLSGRVRVFMEDLEDVTGELKDAGEDVADGLDTLSGAAGSAGDADQVLHQAIIQLKNGLDQLKSALNELDRIANDTSDAPIPDESDDWFEKTEAGYYEDLANHAGVVAGNIRADALPLIGDALTTLKDGFDTASKANPDLQATFRKLETAMKQLSRGADHLTDAAQGLQDSLEAQNDLPQLELPKLSPEFHETEQDLRDAMTAINDELESMNQTANIGGDALSGHLKQVNHQFNAVTDVLRHAGEEFDDPDLVVDITDEDLSNISAGRIEKCRNSGSIAGDVGVGGIAGAMSIELDFDPEDDVKESGEHSMNFQYRTKALVHDCENRGPVTARKNQVGGIVGNMDLGQVVSCRNYGNVESTAGEQVGGIAGYSNSVIRSSWAKCSLSGTRKIGGIVGSGTDVIGCKALVRITDGASCLGAIAGEAEGILHLNWFVSDDLGGVDGVSYAGKAAPASWNDFLSLPDIPEDFRALTVEFYADNQLLTSIDVPYGEAIPAEQLPQVPEKPCCYGSWGNFDPSCILIDQRVEAQYSPWLTAVSSQDGAVLAEGSFQPGTKLMARAPEALPTLEGETAAASYTVRLMETDQPFTALRIRLPEGVRNGKLWVQQSGGSWTELRTTRESSFLRAELSGQEVTIALTASGVALWVWIALAVLAAAVVVMLVVILRKHAKKKKQKT